MEGLGCTDKDEQEKKQHRQGKNTITLGDQLATINHSVGKSSIKSGPFLCLPINYIFYYNTIPLRTLGGNDAFGATSTLSPFTPIDDAAGAALVLELSAAAEDIAATEVASRNPPELVLAALVTVTVTVWISGDVRAPPPCANGFHIILTF